MKYYSNLSLFTKPSLHFLTVILSFTILVPPQNTLQYQSICEPEYFKDYYALPSCNSVVKAPTQAIAWHKDWLVVIFWQWTLSYRFTNWPADWLQHSVQIYMPS